MKKVIAVAAVLAVVSISLVGWAFAGRPGPAQAVSPPVPAETTRPAYVAHTKASAAVASSVDGVTAGCAGDVTVAMLQAADGAANREQSGKSAADIASAWWVDNPAIAAADIALQQQWAARIVPLMENALTENANTDAAQAQVNLEVEQFHPQVLADCQAMASQIINGAPATTDATAPSTTDPVAAPTSAAPAAAASNSPLASVKWSSVTHPLDCTAIGQGIRIAGTHYFDVTGDGVKDAFVQVACRTLTGGSSDQVEVFDGTSGPSAPRLLGVLNPVVMNRPEQEVKVVTVSGSTVTLTGAKWSANAPGCCSDLVWTQTFTWRSGKFQAGAMSSHSK